MLIIVNKHRRYCEKLIIISVISIKTVINNDGLTYTFIIEHFCVLYINRLASVEMNKSDQVCYVVMSDNMGVTHPNEAPSYHPYTVKSRLDKDQFMHSYVCIKVSSACQ